MKCSPVLFVFLTMAACSQSSPKKTTESRATEQPAVEQAGENPAPPFETYATGTRLLAESGLQAAKQYLSPSEPSAAFAHTLKLLAPVSSEAMIKRRNTARVVHSKAWPAAKKWWNGLVSDATQGQPDALQKLNDAYCGAMSMALSDEPYERAAAYAFGAYALENDAKLLSKQFRQLGIGVSVAPYETAKRGDERWQMIQFVGQWGGPDILPFLLHAAHTDEDWRVRRAGLLALSECARKHEACRIDESILDALFAQWPDTRTQTALIAVASALGSERTLRWCDGRLNENAYALSCKQALSKMKSEASFEMLLNWLRTRESGPDAFSPDNFGFREDFALLVPFADEPYAKTQFYSILNRVLAESRRSGFATGGIAKHLTRLADRKEAMVMARSHHEFYLKKWGPEPKTQDRAFLLKTLKRVRQELGDSQLP